MKSIRLFLTLSIVATIILINFLAALHGYQESMLEAERLFDQKLEDYSELLVKFSRPHNTVKREQRLVHKNSHLTMNGIKDTVIYQIREKDGRVVSQSKIFDNHQFNIPLKDDKSYINYEGFRWRIFTRFYSKEARWVHVLEKQKLRYKLAESVILKSVYPIILAIPTIVLIIFFIVRRGLKPVNLLAENVGHKQANDLSPIEINRAPEELLLLTQRINALLARLDDSLSREKRFAADAAHELRTPIAVLNLQMKNLIDGSSDHQQNVSELEQGVKRMSHLVEQILTLNRISPDLMSEQFKPIDIAKLMKGLVAELYPLIDAKGHEIELVSQTTQQLIEGGYRELTIEPLSATSYVIVGEAFALKTIFKNLIENAIKYTPNNGQLRIELEKNEESVIVSVMDSGPGISSADKERIFERFYRINDDRNQSEVAGCGLGLAIVKQMSDLHGAKIRLSDSHFRFENKQKVISGLCVKLIFNNPECN